MKSKGNAKVKGALRVGTRRGVYILVQIESKKETEIYLPLKKCTNYTVILILYSTRICTPCRQYV